MRELALPDDLFSRLQKLAVPLVDTPADIIERLLTHYEEAGLVTPGAHIGRVGSGTKSSRAVWDAKVVERSPRERGATIEIDGHVIRAVSVKEMYEEVLKYLLDAGYEKRLKGLVPFRTSGSRYLIAEKAVHPNGKEFFVPVKHGGYSMEAHKSYKTGIEHLSQFITKLGLKLTYLH